MTKTKPNVNATESSNLTNFLFSVVIGRFKLLAKWFAAITEDWLSTPHGILVQKHSQPNTGGKKQQ
jgi:hypothetical protein